MLSHMDDVDTCVAPLWVLYEMQSSFSNMLNILSAKEFDGELGTKWYE